jgi:uncharacterized protein YndB with AHSA1/START domain
MPEVTQFIVEPGKPELVITRWFDAPARLLFEAFSKPEYRRRWWGPGRHKMSVCEIDFRVGGAWRFVLLADGREVGFRGTFKEIVPYSRIVDTFVYEPIPSAAAVQTSTFEEVNGRTKLTIHSLYPSVESRDGAYNSGMESGVHETHARLDELLATMTSRAEAAAPRGADLRSS